MERQVYRYPGLRPQYFYLQWHITERCNWHCEHCYRGNSSLEQDLSLKELLRIFYQYLRLIRYFGVSRTPRARLGLTGGEPLLREDFFELLKKINKFGSYFLLTVLSNGSLVTKENAREMKSLGVNVFQVSLEGMEKKNDAIRGAGAFSKTINSIEILIESGIKVSVSFTLSKQNMSEVPPLVRLCKRLGVSRLGIRRLVPIGRAERFTGDILSPVELRKIYLYIERKEKELTKSKNTFLRSLGRGCEEGILSQESDSPLGNCAVIDGRDLVILPNGDVIPCRRLPIKLGNALKQDLLNIYYNSNILKQLRNLNNASELCRECRYFDACFSGAKCISYAYFNKLSVPDPQCWRLFKRLPSPALFKNQKEILSKRQRVHSRLLSGARNE